MVAAQLETAHGNDKARRKLELDLAAYQGRELYLATAPGADGVRRVTRRVVKGSLEELRAIAQNFTAQPKAVFIATLADPPSVLLAASADAGIDAGKALKAALTEAGGRGGGNARRRKRRRFWPRSRQSRSERSSPSSRRASTKLVPTRQHCSRVSPRKCQVKGFPEF